MIALVTGVGGFCGPFVVRELRASGQTNSIIGWGRASSTSRDVDEYRSVELTDYQQVDEACAGLPLVDLVIHLAGAMPPKPAEELWRTNVEGTLSLLTGLTGRLSSEARFVNIGSAAQYLPLNSQRALTEEDPCAGLNSYGRSKWAQELLTTEVGRRSEIPVILTRTFNLLGPGLPESFVAGSIVKQLTSEVGSEIPVRIGKGFAERDFLDVRDAAAAYVRLARFGTPGGVYNVCSGRRTRIDELAGILIKLSGSARGLQVGAAVPRLAESDVVFGSNDRLRAELDWTPDIGLSQSLTDMLASSAAAVGNP